MIFLFLHTKNSIPRLLLPTLLLVSLVYHFFFFHFFGVLHSIDADYGTVPQLVPNLAFSAVELYSEFASQILMFGLANIIYVHGLKVNYRVCFPELKLNSSIERKNAIREFDSVTHGGALRVPIFLDKHVILISLPGFQREVHQYSLVSKLTSAALLRISANRMRTRTMSSLEAHPPNMP